MAARLVDVLDDPQGSPRDRSAAAELLELFASGTERAALEAVLLERVGRDDDEWVQTYVLRAMVRQRLALSDKALARLCKRLCEDPRRDLASVLLEAVLLAARSPDQDAIVQRAVRRVSADVARDVLLHTDAPLPSSTRDALYQRCLDGDRLDPSLAWATLEQPASQRLVLDHEPVDLSELETATEGWEAAAIDAVLADRPELLGRALAGFALPPGFVRARVDGEALQASAARLIDATADELDAGRRVRGWSAVRAALAALPAPARHLDVLMAARGDAVRNAFAGLRVNWDPPPDFDTLPPRAVDGQLSRAADPLPRDRALFTWLAGRPEPRLHHAGLRGLLAVDPGGFELTSHVLASPEPLVQLLVLEARLVAGDDGARATLIEAARAAPHVVLRAQALRSLRAAKVPPIELFQAALHCDHERFDMFYLPAVSEAALGLARGAALTELEALSELVDAHLAIANDDAPHAIKAAIRSWLEPIVASAAIRPVWYEIYMAEARV